MPIFSADVLVVCISTAVHGNTKDDEDLESELARHTDVLLRDGTHNDGNNFE